MRNFKIYLSLVVVSLALGGCSLLEKEPLDFVSPQAYYKTEEDVEHALMGVYAALTGGGLYSNNIMGKLGLSADLGFADYSSEKGTVAYYDVIASDTKILSYWQDCYRGISRANMLLENIGGAEMDERDKDDARGQALFLRAYNYLLLVTRFGDVPLILNTPASGKAEDVQIARTPVREVYLRIIRDLEDAAELTYGVEELPGVTGARITKSAVWGILARACLYMAGQPVNEPGMYAKAKEAAAKVIATGKHALNSSYEQVFINYIQDKYDIGESIFEVDFYGTGSGVYSSASGQVGRNNGIKYSNVDNEEIGTSPGILHSSDYFHKLFEEGDLRRDWTIAPFTYENDGTKTYQNMNDIAWKLYCGKFRREYELSRPKNGSWTPINFPILRYSDVLLMYAEGVAADPQNNDGGDFERAVEYVNQVRRRGFGKEDLFAEAPDVDIDVQNKDELWEAIKDERARELGLEMLRKDDLIRWGEFYTRMQYVNGLANKNSFTSSFYVSARLYYGNAGERDVLWPIPSYEMGVNRKLVQNKGW